MRYYGHLLEEDYMAYAQAHAHVNPDGKDYDYWVNIENFENLQRYNETRLLQRRPDELYPDTDFYAWQWDNIESRLEYEKIRIRSDNAFSRSTFVLGGILLNHLISAVDALRAARNAEPLDPDRVRIGFSPLPSRGMALIVSKSF
jgi:hypothetical protein